MNLQEILAVLTTERTRLDQAIAALTGLGASKPSRGRPPKAVSFAPARKRRVMSPEARAKIAAAQRARWAKQKRRVAARPAKKAAAKKTAGRKGMSAAARKKLSALMKGRWEARKKAAQTA